MPTAGKSTDSSELVIRPLTCLRLTDHEVITGCNSGIGHAFARVLLDEGYFVYALDLTAGEKLLALQGPKCQIGRLDVTSVESIWEFKKSLGKERVDVLLNVAGIMPSPNKDTLETITLATLQNTFATNTFGPLLLTQALLPNVLAAPAPRHIAVVSSRVGSIADNSSGGSYAYRSSKTAVNMFFRNLSLELKGRRKGEADVGEQGGEAKAGGEEESGGDGGVIVSMLHPGFVKTGLSPETWAMKEAVEPEEAAGKLWGVVKGKGMEDSGKFWHREGMELPW